MSENEAFETARKRLWDELVNLHDTWDQYQALFSHSSERVRMLNACAGWFFAAIQRVLLRETVLGVSRLTDPVKSGKFNNLTLGTLLADPALIGAKGTQAKIQEAINRAIKAAESVRAHRNKYIAHLDHPTATGSAEEPLPGLSKEHITSVIALMEAAYNVYNHRVRDAQAFFEVDSMQGAEALVAILAQSERWRKFRELHPGRTQDGNSPPDAA